MNEDSNSMVAQENRSPMPMGGTLAVNYVGFWSRLIAAIIDAIVVGIFYIIGTIIAFVLGIAIGGASEGAGGSGDIGSIVFLLSYGVTAILTIIYYPYMEASESQATIGKQVLGMKVVDLDGNRITFMKAFIRAPIGKFLSGIILYLGFLIIGFHSRKQGLHDMIAGTYVVPK